MPIYSRKNYAELCGVSKSYITQYVKRDQISLNNKGDIDTDKRINLDFLNKRLLKRGKTLEEAIAEMNGIELPVDNKGQTSIPQPPKQENFAPSPDQIAESAADTVKYNLETQVKELEIEKREQEISINNIKLQKLSGEVIPTEIVRTVFLQHFKSFTTSFHQAAENFISVIAKQTTMTREQQSSLRGTLKEIINQAGKDGVEASKLSVDGIVNEYSQTRGVGERK